MARRITPTHGAGTPAELKVAPWTVSAGVRLAISGGLADYGDATVARVGTVLHRFDRWCAAVGIVDLEAVGAEDVERFVNAPLPAGGRPMPATVDGRRAALRVLFRTLRGQGCALPDPTIDVRVPSRTRVAARPLTDEEIALGRLVVTTRSAAGGGYAAAAWALAEAGAMTSEIPRITVADLDDATAPGWVRLPGTARHDPRRVELTGWGAAVLKARVHRLAIAGRAGSLAYKGRAVPGGAASQSAVCTALKAVLHEAGLGQEHGVRPVSIRHWAGRSRYDAGMALEQVACWLGARSLDTVAYDLAIDWRGAS